MLLATRVQKFFHYNYVLEIICEYGSLPKAIGNYIDNLEASSVKHSDVTAFCTWKNPDEEAKSLTILNITRRSLIQSQLSGIVKIIHCPSLEEKEWKCIEGAHSRLSSDDCSQDVS